MAEVHPPRRILEETFGPPISLEEPIEVAPSVRRLTAANASMMTGPGTNTYLVGDRDVAVIDPGPDLAPHLDAIERAVSGRGATLRWIVLTHHHVDHAPGARPLAERTGAEVVAFGHPRVLDPDRRATEGSIVDARGFSLRALHTPGHASDHLCWLLENERILFSGDHVMQGSTVVIRPPDGDMGAYVTSLRRLLTLAPQLAGIAPGHGSMLANPAGVLGSLIAHRLERERRVIDALEVGQQATSQELLAVVYGDVSGPLLNVALHSLQAHIEKLACEGRVREVVDGAGISRWQRCHP